MSATAAHGCTCGRCSAYMAPEQLCRGALAELVLDALDTAGEAREGGDQAAADAAQHEVATLKGMMRKAR